MTQSTSSASPEAQGLGRKGATPVLTVIDLAVAYGRISALQRLSLSLDRGGLVLVLGPNGAGKTSLVKALAGAVVPRGGRVELEGRDITWVPAHRRVRQGISLVPEGRGTLSGLSVLDNLDLGWHAGPGDSDRDRAAEMERIFTLFPVLGERMRQDCSTLSGGEMQMLAIARALLARPRVLLLDEPSLGLAPLAIERVYAALADLNADGLPMVLVEQKAVPLNRLPSTTIVLQAGRQVYMRNNARPSDAELAELYLGEARST